eukprot:GSChrysophyteH1.ASY1.ANO1.2801.1 assembled CDS
MVLESEAEAYKCQAAEEMVDIVDENNVTIGPRRRAEMRENKLRHRATYAFVRDSSGYFYVQKRSMLKDYCPGYWDPTPGGVVSAGESYEETNRREIEEEMGIPADSPMEHLFTWLYEDDRCRCFGDCWEVIYDGPIKLQRTEVDVVEKMSMREILDRSSDSSSGYDFTADSMDAVRKYVELKGCLEPSGACSPPVVVE